MVGDNSLEDILTQTTMSLGAAELPRKLDSNVSNQYSVLGQHPTEVSLNLRAVVTVATLGQPAQLTQRLTSVPIPLPCRNIAEATTARALCILDIQDTPP